ncbi:hypothetical protein O181_132031 [Austropuccinia psidii MF-1]|uniref:Uncharacterized protein n=1 Tax=Austropuccinia psidii MF-1 TaxID=1389203 RepID=A0A9Q3L5R7_9BASI|nr:hypothetical protein [Austropuccinia psidii MF-1]
MVKKLRWFLILLVIHPILLLPSPLPRYSKVKSSPVPQKFPTHSCCHSYFHSSCSPHSSHTRPDLNPAVRPSPIKHPRNSPIVTSQQLQPVASTSKRRDELSPLPSPAAQVFQCRDQWPI